MLGFLASAQAARGINKAKRSTEDLFIGKGNITISSGLHQKMIGLKPQSTFQYCCQKNLITFEVTHTHQRVEADVLFASD